MTNEQLTLRIQSGTDTAKNMLKLWQQNRGYICKVVNHYKAYAEEDDLQQEGYLGLCEAVEHYRPEEGASFLSYAGHWIRQRIVRYIRSNGSIRLPEFMQGRIRDYRKMLDKWEKEYRRKPTEKETCCYLDISREKLRELEQVARMGKVTSLDVPIGEDADGSLYDLLPGEENQEEAALERIQREQLRAVLWPMVDALPGQQPRILKARYLQGKTLRAIAEEDGKTLAAIQQQERKGIRELRKPQRSRRLLPFLEDQVYSQALRGNGVETFNRTWTSSTERAALWEAEEQELEKMLEGMRKRPELTP